MDEKTIGLLGAAAAVAVSGRRLRPAAKLMMKGYIAVADATASTRRDLARLYAEAREESRAEPQGPARASTTAKPAPSAPSERAGA